MLLEDQRLPRNFKLWTSHGLTQHRNMQDFAYSMHVLDTVLTLHRSTNSRTLGTYPTHRWLNFPFCTEIHCLHKDTLNSNSKSQSFTLPMQAASPLTRDAQGSRLPTHLSEEFNWKQRSHKATISKPREHFINREFTSIFLLGIQLPLKP